MAHFGIGETRGYVLGLGIQEDVLALDPFGFSLPYSLVDFVI